MTKIITTIGIIAITTVSAISSVSASAGVRWAPNPNRGSASSTLSTGRKATSKSTRTNPIKYSTLSQRLNAKV